MFEVNGLLDHRVIQRDTESTGRISVTGSSDGPVLLQVLHQAGRPVTGWEQVGMGGQWKADLTVPVGGPYDVVAREGDGAPRPVVRSVLVGDLWLLAGQSNMQGVGVLDHTVEQPSPLVALLDMTRTWRPAIDPLHRLFASPDLIHTGTDDPEQRAALIEAEAQSPFGAGLGVPFANAMVAATGVPVGLIATAHGGTSLAGWSPDLRHEGGASLFGSMLLSLDDAGGRIAGALWYQGESDALELHSEGFSDRLSGFVDALRGELSQPDLPFFHVQISRVVRLPGVVLEEAVPHWDSVREAQRTIDLGPGGMVAAVDLPLSDFIHISTGGLQRVGRRLALLASGRAPALSIDSVETVVLMPPALPEVLGLFQIRVKLANAALPLTPAEHISGFSVRDASGADRPIIFSTLVDANDSSTVVLSCLGEVGEGDSLWYGQGFDAYCNLVDANDMAVPMFGPIPLASAAEPAS